MDDGVNKAVNKLAVEPPAQRVSDGWFWLPVQLTLTLRTDKESLNSLNPKQKMICQILCRFAAWMCQSKTTDTRQLTQNLDTDTRTDTKNIYIYQGLTWFNSCFSFLRKVLACSLAQHVFIGEILVLCQLPEVFSHSDF